MALLSIVTCILWFENAYACATYLICLIVGLGGAKSVI
jgi:hypothetical protein